MKTRRQRRKARKTRQRGGWSFFRLSAPESPTEFSYEYLSKLIRSTISDQELDSRLEKEIPLIPSSILYAVPSHKNETFLYMALKLGKLNSARRLFNTYISDYESIAEPLRTNYLRYISVKHYNNVIDLLAKKQFYIPIINSELKLNISSVLLYNIVLLTATRNETERITSFDAQTFSNYIDLYKNIETNSDLFIQLCYSIIQSICLNDGTKCSADAVTALINQSKINVDVPYICKGLNTNFYDIRIGSISCES